MNIIERLINDLNDDDYQYNEVKMFFHNQLLESDIIDDEKYLKILKYVKTTYKKFKDTLKEIGFHFIINNNMDLYELHEFKD